MGIFSKWGTGDAHCGIFSILYSRCDQRSKARVSGAMPFVDATPRPLPVSAVSTVASGIISVASERQEWTWPILCHFLCYSLHICSWPSSQHATVILLSTPDRVLRSFLMWVLGIQTHDLMFPQQVLLLTGPSPQPTSTLCMWHVWYLCVHHACVIFVCLSYLCLERCVHPLCTSGGRGILVLAEQERNHGATSLASNLPLIFWDKAHFSFIKRSEKQYWFTQMLQISNRILTYPIPVLLLANFQLLS